MYLRIVIIVIGYFITANLLTIGVVRASEQQHIAIIISSNFSKSVHYFYSNTVADITEYFNKKFDFYSTMIKNLISQSNFNKIYTLLYDQVSTIIIDTIETYLPIKEQNNYK